MSDGHSDGPANGVNTTSSTSTSTSSARLPSATATPLAWREMELLEPTAESEGLERGALIGDDIFLSWGGFAILAAVLLAGGIWRIRRRRRVNPREPQVLGRLLDEVEGQELVPATANGYGTS
ncbi:unnamed protein product [Symbiodinium natans]|uniref:Uncharacterized protein n=1 Tax=Symbiodinium natans TaxID=878477 RepID=A0A812RKE1_9DINO|nr:unnamed protein product [Symbiodinium natans]